MPPHTHLKFLSPEAPPTPQEIEAMEAATGAVLPADFRAYLEVANGAVLDYSIKVQTAEAFEELSFCKLFSTRRGGYETFLGELAVAQRAWQLPLGVFPFARDGGCSLVFLDLTPEGRGRVVAFVEGLPGWAGRTQVDSFVWLADSFADYLAQLYPNED